MRLAYQTAETVQGGTSTPTTDETAKVDPLSYSGYGSGAASTPSQSDDNDDDVSIIASSPTPSTLADKWNHLSTAAHIGVYAGAGVGALIIVVVSSRAVNPVRRFPDFLTRRPGNRLPLEQG